MRSIKSKLLVFLGILIGGICAALGFISYYNAHNALDDNVEMSLPAMVVQSAGKIEASVERELRSLETLAGIDDITNPEVPMEKKLAILSREMERTGKLSMGIINKEGMSTVVDGRTVDLSDRDYFKAAIAGNNYISDPILNKVDGILTVIYAVPIKNNNEVQAVLMSVLNGNNLCELTNEIKIGESGTAFMINNNGITVADADIELVTKGYSTTEASKKDESLKLLAEIEGKMMKRETGLGTYQFEGKVKYVAYAPVENTNWSLGIAVNKDEILSQLTGLKISSTVFAIVFILIGGAFIYLIACRISKRIEVTSKHLEILAEGDLSQEVPAEYIASKDEIGTMTNSMKVMQESLAEMIKKIKDNSGNINAQSENLSSISEEIASASQNVAEAISETAKGTNNQSDELIQITETLNEFSIKLSEMVSEIQVVDSNSRNISTMANVSSSEMNELNESVTNVSNSFKEFNNKIRVLGKEISEINEITALINSVAEQTNLLALNAAIEAARAGEAGKGFAVVAEEIRHLAEQSKDSSEDISKLISSISKNADVIVEESAAMDDEMNSQAKIIDHSITSFKKIIDAVDEVMPKIEAVKTSADSIDSDKDEILNRINGASTISMEVSASAEEISASAEEMNASTEEVASSAQMLSSMTNEMIEEVNKFKI